MVKFGLPVVDGFHWSSLEMVAGLRFNDGNGVDIKGGFPLVDDSLEGELLVRWPTHSPEGEIIIKLKEKSLIILTTGGLKNNWFLELSSDPQAEMPFIKIEPENLHCNFKKSHYVILAKQGRFVNEKGSNLKIIPDETRILLDFSSRGK